MTNLTPGILRLLLWATIVFLVVIILSKSFLFALVAEILYWGIVMAIRYGKNRPAA